MLQVTWVMCSENMALKCHEMTKQKQNIIFNPFNFCLEQYICI